MKREPKSERLRKANFVKHTSALFTYANDPTDGFLFNASNVLVNRNRTIEETTQQANEVTSC